MAVRRPRLVVRTLEDRTTPAGVLDPTLSTDGYLTQQLPTYSEVRPEDVLVQADGKVLAVGSVAQPQGGSHRPAVLRYNPDGALDPAYDGDGFNVLPLASGFGYFFDGAIQGGKLIAVGSTWDPTVGQQIIVARFNTDGTLDGTFRGGGAFQTNVSPLDENAFAVAVLPNNRIVLAGNVQVQAGSSHTRMLVMQFFADGQDDPSFGGTGRVEVDLGPSNGTATAVLAQPDGNIVAAGFGSSSGPNQSFAVVRLTSAGALDHTFDGDGIVKTTPNLTNFHSARDAALTIDGKIVLAGGSSIGPAHRPGIAVLRYNADGSPDTSFGGTGYVLTDLPPDTGGGVVSGVAVQADGKVVAVGTAVMDGGQRSLVARYNRDGTLDADFGAGGLTLTPGVVITDIAPNATEEFTAVDLQPDGRIVAAGQTNFGTIRDLTLARYTNDALTAVDDTYTTVRNTPLVVERLGYKLNDVMPGKFEPIGDLVTGPANAAAFQWVPNGRFTYTPAAGFVGTDTITYKLRTAAGSSNTATITINVVPPNGAPTATADAYGLPAAGPLVVAAPGVLDNDADPDGDDLTAILVDPPAVGTLDFAETGGFTYTPPTGLAAAVTFTYKVSDGEAESAPVTVTLTPAPPPPPAPTAADDFYELPSSGPLLVAPPGVLANDTDPEGDPLSAILIEPPAVGAFSLDATGAFNYDPPADFVGSVTFTYRATDGTAVSGPATVTLTRGPAVSVAGSVLTVRGTGGADVVRLRPSGNAIRVELVTPAGVIRQTVRPAGGPRFTQVIVLLGDGDDRLDATGLRVAVRAAGGAGDNALRTGAGADTVTAGDGVNEIYAGAGNDTVTTGTGGGLIDAGAGNDFVTAGGGANVIDGGTGNDVLVAGGGLDWLIGGAGKDLLVGGLGGDVLEGEAGNDLLIDGTVALVNGGDTLTRVLADYRPTPPVLAALTSRLTVTFDASTDTLTGAGGTDWFWSLNPEDVLDRLAREPLNGQG